MGACMGVEGVCVINVCVCVLIEGAGGRNSPDLVFGSVRPLSNDSGYGHSASSSAHSLASNRTPTSGEHIM